MLVLQVTLVFFALAIFLGLLLEHLLRHTIGMLVSMTWLWWLVTNDGLLVHAPRVLNLRWLVHGGLLERLEGWGRHRLMDPFHHTSIVVVDDDIIHCCSCRVVDLDWVLMVHERCWLIRLRRGYDRDLLRF